MAEKLKVKLSKTKKNGRVNLKSTYMQRTAPKGPVNCKVCGKSISYNNQWRHKKNAHGVDGVKGNGVSRETEEKLKDANETFEEDSMSPSDAQEVLSQIEHLNEGVNNRIEYQIEKNGDGKFQCNICSKSHVSKKLIKNHILGVHAGYKWNCNKCKQGFGSPNKLKSHKIKVHADTTENLTKDANISKQMKVSCKKCSAFLHKNGLKRHMISMHAVL